MRYQIYEAKSVKYDAQQRVGMIATSPETQCLCGFPGFLFASGYTKGTRRHFSRLSYLTHRAYPSALRPPRPYAGTGGRKSPKWFAHLRAQVVR